MSDEPIALRAYESLAKAYAARIDNKPHNAFYDRPAVLSLLPDLQGRCILDAGCGPGAYAEEFVERGGDVTGIDASPAMIELAQTRVGDRAKFYVMDLSKPLNTFDAESFDVIAAPLCLDYIEEWGNVFAEFLRLLKPGGVFVMSAAHPSFDAEYFDTDNYFDIERVTATWTGFGGSVEMPCFRRSIADFFNPFINAGLLIDKVLEPTPTDQFAKHDVVRYRKLMRRPSFMCVRATKPQTKQEQ